MKRMFKALAFAVLGGFSIVAAAFCFDWGFTKLSEARQMDRLPNTPIAALAGGPYAVSGTIEQHGGLLEAPYSKNQVVFVHYRLEEEYRDSDGDLRTRILDSGKRSARFRLTDKSGTVDVNPSLSTGRINWAVDQTYRRRQGDLIYTEWTLKPGQDVEILTRYQSSDDTLVFHDLSYNLPPIVTNKQLQAQGGKSLLAAAALVSLASALVAIGLACLLIALQVHRFWVYVVVMSVVLIGFLWSVGLVQLERDWERAADLYQTRWQAVHQGEASLLQRNDLYAMHQLIQRGARQWPDKTILTALAKDRFPVPGGLDGKMRQQVEGVVSGKALSRFETSWIAWLSAGLGTLLSLVLLWQAIKTIKLKRLIEHLPTAKSTGLSYGLAELRGFIEPLNEQPAIESKLAKQACVAYDYSIQEKRGSGKKSSWITIEQGGERIPFWLKDDAGKAVVYPDKAKISFPEKYNRRQGRRRYTEYWLPPAKNVYCLGFAGLDKNQTDRLAIQSDPDSDFLITTAEEDSLVRSKGAQGFLLTAVSLGSALFAGTALLAANGQLTPGDLLVTALIVPVFLQFYIAILHYNDLVFLRNRTDRAWSNINTILQKRYDLWPALQRTVESYLEHEQSLLEAIGQLRQAPPDTNQTPDQVEQRVGHEQNVSNSLIARIEAYPELRANNVIQEFMEQMEETENYLSLLRNGYSDAVEIYNTRVQSFPDVILAKLFGFKEKRPFNRES